MKDISNLFFDAKKIAIVRTDKIGDMILTLPMYLALKSIDSEYDITVIASEYVSQIMLHFPMLKCEFISTIKKKTIRTIFQENNFDCAFFPMPRFNECIAGFFKKIPIRIGSAYRGYSFCFNHKVYDHRKIAKYHEAEYNVRLIESIAKQNLQCNLIKPTVFDTDIEQLIIIFNKYGISINEPFIIIHPGTGGSAYEWNATNFGKAAYLISQKTNCRVIITGTSAEYEKCRIAQENCYHAINLCGKLDIHHLIATISFSKLLIANSTGIIHLAAALDIPTVGLYPRTPHLSSIRWGPYNKKSITLSPNKTNDTEKPEDMNTITIDNVVDKAIKMIYN